MKTKAHILQFAMALCAVAFFSFTAQAVILPDSQPGPTTMPSGDGATSTKPVQEYPGEVPPSGTYNGTVMD